MIVFDKLWGVMKEKGVFIYLLREKCGVDSKTIRRLRANDNMETKTLINYVWRLTAVWKILPKYIPDEQ